MRDDYTPYLRTLRRVPDDIILSVATRELELDHPDRCVCGWVLREGLARMSNEDAAAVELDIQWSGSVTRPLADRFGGSDMEWGDIYWGVTQETQAPLIERAFVERVAECVR